MSKKPMHFFLTFKQLFGHICNHFKRFPDSSQSRMVFSMPFQFAFTGLKIGFFQVEVPTSETMHEVTSPVDFNDLLVNR